MNQLPAGRPDNLTDEGFVVVRWNGSGAYVQSNKVFRSWWRARLSVANPAREQVVPWQGSQQATLAWVSANDVKPMEWLP